MAIRTKMNQLRHTQRCHYATLSSIPGSLSGQIKQSFSQNNIKSGPLTSQAATLHLKTGHSFTGTSFGSTESRFGETVFSTSITSYTESMTDPSYLSQILVFTTPMIGNYGVPQNSMSPSSTNGPAMMLESNKIQCKGIIVSDLAEKYSHYLAKESLHEWCSRYGVPGITGVDTRAITNLLRNNGTTLGKIAVGKDHDVVPAAEEYWDPAKENLIAQASTKSISTLNDNPKDPNQVRIALLDFGAKANIARSLVRRGASVTVLPWDTPLTPSLMVEFDGLFLSNGPGDPMYGRPAASQLNQLINSEWWCNKPVFGICMGNQILGLAAGMETYRMPYGNRGHNQPVLALASSGVIKKGRIYVTSQNRKLHDTLSHPFLLLVQSPEAKIMIIADLFPSLSFRSIRRQARRFS